MRQIPIYATKLRVAQGHAPRLGVARGHVLSSGVFPEDNVMASKIPSGYIFSYLKNPGTIRLSLTSRRSNTHPPVPDSRLLDARDPDVMNEQREPSRPGRELRTERATSRPSRQEPPLLLGQFAARTPLKVSKVRPLEICDERKVVQRPREATGPRGIPGQISFVISTGTMGIPPSNATSVAERGDKPRERKPETHLQLVYVNGVEASGRTIFWGTPTVTSVIGIFQSGSFARILSTVVIQCHTDYSLLPKTQPDLHLAVHVSLYQRLEYNVTRIVVFIGRVYFTSGPDLSYTQYYTSIPHSHLGIRGLSNMRQTPPYATKLEGSRMTRSKIGESPENTCSAQEYFSRTMSWQAESRLDTSFLI
ncbi:hypothetical protein F511_16312 [Dorcoceras hygrometricum]|uniref:Uncharacterized protein n=1 Tax=Dorcoceras hygrometricum TaxID=472368 RepID=A0A2Z7BC32_9LAMI|nr:hypothetical protein F511_16312 [Dorcoceras hygrometricum]